MPPIKRHVYKTRFGPHYSGLFVARFYGPLLADGPVLQQHYEGWGWYEASVLVSNNKEAKAHFKEWVTDTKAYINEQLQI